MEDALLFHDFEFVVFEDFSVEVQTVGQVHAVDFELVLVPAIAEGEVAEAEQVDQVHLQVDAVQ